MVTDNTDGSQTFRIYCPHADTVAIVGDFTDADSPGLCMERMEDGWWQATLRIAPGDHTFRYVVNGHGSIPDYAAAGLARDESGAWVSCLHVPEPKNNADTPESRSATITDAQVRQLLSGRRVTLTVAGGETLVLAMVTSHGGAGRVTPRPDRPLERRRDAMRDVPVVERRGERSRLG